MFPATFEMNSGFRKRKTVFMTGVQEKVKNDGALSWEEEFIMKTVTRKYPSVNLKYQK